MHPTLVEHIDLLRRDERSNTVVFLDRLADVRPAVSGPAEVAEAVARPRG